MNQHLLTLRTYGVCALISLFLLGACSTQPAEGQSVVAHPRRVTPTVLPLASARVSTGLRPATAESVRVCVR